MSVVREQSQAQEYAKLIVQLEDLQRAVRLETDCVLMPEWTTPGGTPEVRRAQVYTYFRKKLENVPHDLVTSLNLHHSLAKVEAAVERLHAAAPPDSSTATREWPRAESITEARHAENAAIRAIDGMVQTVRERTRAIWQKQGVHLASLTLIVLGACLLAVLVVLLLYSYRLSVSAQRRAEAERDRFFSLSADLLCISDFNGFFKQLSSSWNKTFGYDRREFYERPYVEFVHPDDQAATLNEMEKLKVNNGTPNFENRYRARAGQYRWLRWNATADVKRKLVYASARDVTELKRAQSELEEFTTRLQRSNRELEDFASVASHDLQEPLRKVLTFGDRLQAGCGDTLSAQGRDYVERMRGAAQRMQGLIHDLLAFSRVATQAQPFAPVDLARVVRDVLTDLEVRIEELGAQVTVQQLPTIEADPLQMRQLLQNLIGNALKFHRPNVPPVVRISATTQDDEPASQNVKPTGPVCHLQIEDNGIGFEEKYCDRIFNVFQRLHGRDAYEGTGIGLAICRKIAERHGGSITATSTPGQGSTFSVTLPISRSADNQT
ncbi:MAG: ATP-binding protein [Planctomycetota bacterium]